MEESSVRCRIRSIADVVKETKRKVKGNSTPRSPFILRKTKRSKIVTPCMRRSLLNKQVVKGEDSLEVVSVADIDNSATSLRGNGRNKGSTNIDNGSQEQFNLDPLQDVLTMMRHQEQSISHFHENRKLALAEECKKELEEVRKKYCVLVQNEEAVCNQRLKDVKELRFAIQKNQIFADLFRSNLTEDDMHGNLEEVQGQTCDLIQKLPKLGISKIPIPPSPSSSAPVQSVHSLPLRMEPPPSLAVHSPQGQKGNLMQKLRKKDISEMPILPSPLSSVQPFPFPLPGFPPLPSVVRSTSVLPCASNSQIMSQNNLTSQDDQDHSVLSPITIHVSSMATSPTLPTASNVYFRAPAPHLHRYKP